VDGHGEIQDFITGFEDDEVVHGRPCDVFRMDDKSFLLSDDYAGVIYYVHAK
jgi:glucose/arabinose dehydrogenase